MVRDRYKKHLAWTPIGMAAPFKGNDCMTQKGPIMVKTEYFRPGKKRSMMNLRAVGLQGLLRIHKGEGAAVAGETGEHGHGKFGWIMDPKGNKTELWEPIDKAFL